MMVTEYQLPEDVELVEYRIFPDNLEDDDHVFFHGTAATNLASILNDGFSPGSGELKSVSFSKGSALALDFACNRRSPDSPDGCVLAVRYENLDRRGLTIETSILYDYTRDPPPEIIGFCLVPASYQYH